MLFDLTGRGRRKTVKIIYSGLAALFLIGFVGFGVGTVGSGGGGIAEIFGEGKSGGETDYSSQVKKAKKLTVAQPNNPGAWSGLIHVLLLQARTGSNYNNTENAFTAKAKPLLTEVQSAWQRYLKLTRHPSGDVAAEVLIVYATAGGIPNPPAALQALKVEIAGRPPSATLYYRLAEAAYAAGDIKEGEKAGKKAIALAPAGERTILQNYLAKAKQVAVAQKHGIKTGPGGSRTITIPASSLPKGATSGQTVTIPASQLPKGATGTSGTGKTPAPAQSTSTAAPTTTAPKK